MKNITMIKQLEWNFIPQYEKNQICKICGWYNKYGELTPTGKRIAYSSWDQLSSAAQRIILNKATGK